MFKNQLLIMLRSLKKRRIFFTLNIFCLSIGFATYLALHRYISYESHFDSFHTNAEQIVRVHASRYHQNVLTMEMTDICLAAGPDIQSNFPEVERFVRMKKSPAIFYYNGEWTKSEKAAYVSEDFFKVFSFKLLRGSDSLALRSPFTIVLSENLAKKIFKGEDPIGKTINFRGRLDFEITGIFEDMPTSSHMDLDALISFETYLKIAQKMVLEEPWRWDGFYTYLKLAPNVSRAALESKLPSLIETKTGTWLKNTGQQLQLTLMPLTDIHLNSNINGEWKTNGDGKMISYLKIISIGVLLLALINYISLATAKSLERAREVGVRKVMGSSRSRLIFQFVFETSLVMLFSVIMGIIWIALAQTLLPTQKFLALPWHVITPFEWMQFVVIIIISVFLAALYPAFVLSGFQPAKVLKSSIAMSSDSGRVRKILVTVQFVLSLVLIVWIFTASRQINFLQSQPLGFNKDLKLVVRDSEVYDSLYRRHVATFRLEVVRIPGVKNITYIETLPGEQLMPYANSVRRLKADTSQVGSFSFCRVDENFAAVLSLKKMAGQFFTESTPKDDVLITASAAKQLGYPEASDAVNDQLVFRDDTVNITGVIEDFHFFTPKHAIQPLIFQYNRTAGYYYVVDIESNDSQKVLESVEKLYRSEFTGQPFNYFFLDDHYNKQYATDIEFGDSLLYLTLISSLLTCIGLTAMSFYSATMRKREIGIRKTFGASTQSIVTLLTKQYLILIAVASLFALPIAFYLSSEWLKSFVMKIELSVWIFLIPLMTLVVISLFAVGFQTIRAAMTNPVESLRHE